MAEPVWLTRIVVDAIHREQLLEHGGTAGLRHEGLLESALMRPRNRLAYAPSSDMAALAASYGYGLATNHPFLDGNKRVAFLAMYVFLALNGSELETEEPDVVTKMRSLAAGEVNENQLATWVRERLQPIDLR